MIKNNNLYYYKYFCEKELKLKKEIVLSLEEESNKTYNDYLVDIGINEAFYDIVDVLLDKTIVGVLIDDLYDLGEKNV